nr:hypothetical protein BaRGS_010163 [Batillaria attramentaria]
MTQNIRSQFQKSMPQTALVMAPANQSNAGSSEDHQAAHILHPRIAAVPNSSWSKQNLSRKGQFQNENTLIIPSETDISFRIHREGLTGSGK